ncbi:MAG: vWA domain-containing protein [Vicinamibacterales bacterium]
MFGDLDLGNVVFGAPQFLWLLPVPAALLLLWVWRFTQRIADLRRWRERRTVPVRERPGVAGDLPQWLLLILATACLIVAVARPRGPSTMLGRSGVDIVILQDGSASMQVDDMVGTRWQRSMKFLRVLGDALSWNDDRIALTVFAHIATPQVRLTRDPNTVFFFLDHLQARPPFRLEDDTTWDTNLEQGLAWGLRLLEKDAEIHGPSANAKMFVMLSDGESWSGEVARSLSRAADAHVPLYVIGVGTLAGGMLPIVKDDETGVEASPGRSRLDRASLQRIASAGGGQYFELDRDPDGQIANRIIDAGRRMSRPTTVAGEATELYWRLLVAAVALSSIGLLFLREPTELWVQLAGAALAVTTLGRMLW